MDFIILKVNGQDVSSLRQQDALKILEEAPEPITVEVLRKSSVDTEKPYGTLVLSPHRETTTIHLAPCTLSDSQDCGSAESIYDNDNFQDNNNNCRMSLPDGMKDSLWDLGKEIYSLNRTMEHIQKQCELLNIPVISFSRPEHIYETIPGCSETDDQQAPDNSTATVQIHNHFIDIASIYRKPFDHTYSNDENLPDDNDYDSPPALSGKEEKDNNVDYDFLPCDTILKPAANEKMEDTSSAYNTGGSSCDSALALELLITDNIKQMQEKQVENVETQENQPINSPRDSDIFSVTSCENCIGCIKLPKSNKRKTSINKQRDTANIVKPTMTKEELVEKAKEELKKSENTNRARRVSHPLQAPKIESLLDKISQWHLPNKSVDHGCDDTDASFSYLPTQSYPIYDNKHLYDQLNDWKVKRRADGTRYIARRNKLLKQREHIINEERSGITTDDDAVDIKTGKYWSREERRRHINLEKQRRKSEERPPQSRAHQFFYELGQRRRLDGLDFDDFTTVQEILAQGNRGGQGGKMLGGLVSVTTV